MKKFIFGAGGLTVLRLINDEAFSVIVVTVAVAALTIWFLGEVIKEAEK